MYPKIYRAFRRFWPGGQDTQRRLNELERTQWLSREALQAYQLGKLQQLIKHAYDNVPFYHKFYKGLDIHPEDIRSLSDFEALPFITKTEIRANLDDMVAKNFPKDALESNHTGGSTGEPLHFFITDSFWWGNAANEFRVRRWHGFNEGERMAWLWGDQRDVPDWSWKRKLRANIMNQRFLNAFTLTEPKMQTFAEMLVEWQPFLIKGYATTLTVFAQFLKEKGITNIQPQFIESTAEKMWRPQRELIEDVLNCRVADLYSSREMGAMAYQCQHGSQHALTDLRYIEIIANGQVAQPGQLGEVVVTSFDHLAMPFIRYKNEDMAIYAADSCPCGRSLPVLEEVVGRTNDYLVTTAGKFVHSEIFAYLLRARPEVFSYQVHQPDKEHLNVKVVCNQTVSPDWTDMIRQQIQEQFGQTMQLSVEIVDDIPLTPSGKHRYIISEVKPDFQ